MPTLYFSLTTSRLDPLIGRITDECQTALHAECLWVRPEEIMPPQTVRHRLAACDALILVLGPGSAQENPPANRAHLVLNERVRFEILTAIHRDLTLVPVCLDDLPLPEREQADSVWKHILDARPRRLRTERWTEDLHALFDGLHAEFEFRRGVSEKMEQAAADEPLPPVTDEAGDPLSPPRLGLEFSQSEQLQRVLDSERHNLETARRAGDRTAENNALSALGMAYARMGQTRHAIQCFEQQRPIVRERNDPLEECDLLANLGDAYAVSGDLTRARQCYEEQLCRADAVHAQAFIASAYNGLGHVHVKRGETARAIDCYQKALAHYRELEDHDKEVELLVGIGLNQQKTGAWRQAEQTLEEALASAKFVENRKEEARVRVDLAETYMELQEPGRAREYLDAAEEILNRFEADWTHPWKSRIDSLRSALS